ncbi:MAG: MBL fold metallo-hydrolase [Rhodospirillaceae bacterium]|nr:MBL fold metallo-hydrolase [Rhodospirillaceae bacterium]MCY4238908.1 MBL fold metallo-hydrolase [Rhodospirillaceae bacterium]MCY4311190.1 MBL fold metallo-hydrolase [Rhodospirillaceae bacterium]
MADGIPFDRSLDFEYGQVEAVSPLIRRVIAPNGGPFTFHGTGTYVVGRGKVAVVDPGPLLTSHIKALKNALRGETITHILITHTHRDHSPAAAPLKQEWSAPTYGFGPHGGGRIEAGAVVEAGGDDSFMPDVVTTDGDVIEGAGWTVEAVHTPGHTSNHLCFHLKEENALFSGDHVMGWSTTIVSPPDGDMKNYIASLDKLIDRRDDIYWPTHGAPIRDPETFVPAIKLHRLGRENQILQCLKDGLTTIDEMVPQMYANDIPPAMYPAAARSILAQLVWLVQKEQVLAEGDLGIETTFRLP